MGGSNGSTYASTMVGFRSFIASCILDLISDGSLIAYPLPPQSSAKLAKSIGENSTPNSGFPRNPICSHLIIPKVLFLITITLIGRLYCTAVANSPISMVRPPSPTNATDCLSGKAICAAIAYGKPFAILDNVPDTENFMPFLILIYRAAHEVFVPQSTE